jgi:hypothetical protein
MGEFLTLALDKVEGNGAILALVGIGILYILAKILLKKKSIKGSFTQLKKSKIEIDSEGNGITIEDSFNDIDNSSVRIK